MFPCSGTLPEPTPLTFVPEEPFMQEELLRPYSLFQCFSVGFRIYRSHLIPISMLFFILLLPSLLMGIFELEMEHILFFITVRFTEAAMALGILTLMFQSIFPTVGILNIARTRLIFGILHIAFLQMVLFFIGSSFVVLRFPFNMLVFALLMLSIFAFAFAQIIYIIERETGFRALVASLRLVQTNLFKTIATIFLLGFLKLVLFTLLFYLFLPDSIFAEGFEDMQAFLLALQSQEVLQALRWTQYLGYLLLYPFAAIVLVLLYIDLKVTHSILEESTLRDLVAPLLSSPLPPHGEAPQDSSEEPRQ